MSWPNVIATRQDIAEAPTMKELLTEEEED